jgi:N-acetyl-anhydromuramyl-L-alanine amidase AmpD
MYIDKETYRIKSYNKYNSTPNKSQIVISFSLRKNDYHIKHLKYKEYGKTKKWNTYSISRDGNIYEHYDPKYYTDFLGIKKIDRKSISIVLENMCSLIKYDDNQYVNWLNESCSVDSVKYKKFLGLKYWEVFPEIQFNSLIELCNHLCDEFNIPKKVIDFHHYNLKIGDFNGIVLKSNYFEDTTAINPLFDLQKFNEMLQSFN